MLRLKSLTYTSVARPDLGPGDIRAIHQTARHLNGLDGVTGLLIYDGRQFLQLIEGAESAIDDLLRRLQVDPRHSGLTIEDQRFIDKREFPDWSMKLAQVSVADCDAPTMIAGLLPATVPESVRAKVAVMIAGQS